MPPIPDSPVVGVAFPLGNSPPAIVPLAITGINIPAILSYFSTFNVGDFTQTAALFAAHGEMRPPFEEAIRGRDAIAAYLQSEAQNFILHPATGVTETDTTGQISAQVAGKVQTPLFTVNVHWLFLLNPQGEIQIAAIKLLASPQEMLKLQRFSPQGAITEATIPEVTTENSSEGFNSQ
jgi:hypothetical protein